MEKEIFVNDGNPLAIYNSDKKELVGLFANGTLCQKYLFKQTGSKYKGRIQNALHRKTKITNSVFDFCVVVRRPNDIQLKELEGLPYVIRDGYETPNHLLMTAFSKDVYQRQIKAIG